MNKNLSANCFTSRNGNRNSPVRFSIIFLLAAGLGLNSASAQNSNVTISTSPTANGCWNPVLGPPNVYTFTPTGDDANVNVADIVAIFSGSDLSVTGIAGCEFALNPYGLQGNVIILTERAKGKQPGNVTVAAAISASPFVAADFTIVAGGNITVSSPINLAGASGSPGIHGVNITLTAGKNGAVKILSPVASTGGSGAAADDAGGDAGQIIINGDGGITLHADLSAVGGKAHGTGADGKPGNITFNDGAPAITTGGGNNDGHTGGVISGGKTLITGSGKFKTSKSDK